MSNPSCSLEDAAKTRIRDGKMRREEGEHPQPEGKRLKLGNEGGNLGKERAEEEEEDKQRTFCSGREELGTQMDEEGQMVRSDAFIGGLLLGESC